MRDAVLLESSRRVVSAGDCGAQLRSLGASKLVRRRFSTEAGHGLKRDCSAYEASSLQHGAEQRNKRKRERGGTVVGESSDTTEGGEKGKLGDAGAETSSAGRARERERERDRTRRRHHQLPTRTQRGSIWMKQSGERKEEQKTVRNRNSGERRRVEWSEADCSVDRLPRSHCRRRSHLVDLPSPRSLECEPHSEPHAPMHDVVRMEHMRGQPVQHPPTGGG